MRLSFFGAAAAVLALVFIACSSAADETVEAPAASEPAAADLSSSQATEFPLIKGPVSADGLQAIFATPDLSVGRHRVGFVLTSPEGLVREPTATVQAMYFPSPESEPQVRQTALAEFRLWPYGTRGIYTTNLTFDSPGSWGIEISVFGADGPSREARLFFEVAETTSAPMVGSAAVPSESKTLGDVDRISQLTTGSLRDPDLYRVTIADAVSSGLPTVVVMASPAFCTNAVCGPQVDVLQQLKNKHQGEANFVHVDFYDNPEEIQGDLSRARLSPTVMEWGLQSTEWSFVIDRDGVVSARFESFATLAELEQALRDLL